MSVGQGWPDYAGPIGGVLANLEGAWHTRRVINWMVLGGVFHRYPSLKLGVTEVPGNWWADAVAKVESSYIGGRKNTIFWAELYESCPEAPSKYYNENVFVGASFIAPFEVAHAIENGYVDNVIWGADYPHTEWTFKPRTDTRQESYTHLSLRFAMSGVPIDSVTKIVGANAIRIFSLQPNQTSCGKPLGP